MQLQLQVGVSAGANTITVIGVILTAGGWNWTLVSFHFSAISIPLFIVFPCYSTLKLVNYAICKLCIFIAVNNTFLLMHIIKVDLSTGNVVVSWSSTTAQSSTQAIAAFHHFLTHGTQGYVQVLANPLQSLDTSCLITYFHQNHS